MTRIATADALTDATDTHHLPLHGLRVIEQGSFITAPYAALLLADMGADVIKVERPGTGDIFRTYDGTLYSPTFQAMNRNKRSVTLDPTSDDDREVFDELIRSADVYIHNFRPGADERLGVHSGRLMDLNPELIYCAISGLGSTGPRAKRPAYDAVAQAYSGMLSLTTDHTKPSISGPAVADAVCGLYAAHGVLAALVRRGIRGGGQLVEISMMEAMAHFLIEPYSSFFTSRVNPGPQGRARVSQSYAMRCADERLVALHLSSPPKFWLGLLQVLGLTELADDDRFSTHTARVKNYDELGALFQQAFETKPREQWLDALAAADVPHAPVLELSEAIDDLQFRHLELEVTTTHPVEGLVRSIRPAHRFDGVITTETVAPPALGEHNDSVREELFGNRLNAAITD